MIYPRGRKGRQAADRRWKKKRKETKSNMAEAALNTCLQVSTVWKYFTKTDKTVSCDICKATLKYHGNTTTMHKNLKLHPVQASYSSSDVSREKHQQQTTMTDFSTHQISDQSKRKITGLLLNFIVKDMRPLAAVSGIGFKDIMHFFRARLRYPVP